MGSLDVQSLPVADVAEFSSGNSESESYDEPCTFGHSSSRRQQSRSVFDREEEKKLRKVIQAKWPSHVPELDVAINTGIRKGSQYGLTWDMVDWKSRELHIPNTETKNGEPLHVPLNDTAIAAFKAVFEGGNGQGTRLQIEENWKSA